MHAYRIERGYENDRLLVSESEVEYTLQYTGRDDRDRTYLFQAYDREGYDKELEENKKARAARTKDEPLISEWVDRDLYLKQVCSMSGVSAIIEVPAEDHMFPGVFELDRRVEPVEVERKVIAEWKQITFDSDAEVPGNMIACAAESMS